MKPCFKLSNSSKRKARLRHEAVKSYVETICMAAIARSSANHADAKSQVRNAARCLAPSPIRAPRQRPKDRASSPCSKPQPVLIPAGQVGQAFRSVKDRTRGNCLNGADIYVARMGWKSGATDGGLSCCPGPSRDTDIPFPI